MKLNIKHIKKWSLTARLLFFFAIISLLVWTVATVITVNITIDYSKTFFDNQQILLAKTLLNLHIEPHNTQLPPTDLLLPFGSDKTLKREDDDVLGFALFSAQGEMLLSDGEHGNDFPFLPDGEGFRRVKVDDDEWRILWLQSEDKTRIAAVGQEKEYRNDMILDILWGQISPWIFTLPFLLLAFALALYRELRPLRNIAKELNTRKAHDTKPILHANIPPEIQPVIAALNTLFERIGILLAHERAFVANAAHELRTPITGLKIQAEVMAMSDEDPEAQKRALQKILQATNKCSHLIDQLLLLSQLENQFHSSTKPDEKSNIFQSLDWEKLMADACYEAQDNAAAKHITLEYTIHAIPMDKKGVPSLWAIVLRNLLDNAIRYTSEGALVRVSLSTGAICVENTGTSIDENILPHLGERFYRPPGQEASGSGLGLAIVKHIVTLHNAHFSIENISTSDSTHPKKVQACIQF